MGFDRRVNAEKSTSSELLGKLTDAISFITRSFGIPKMIVADAASAAYKVLMDYFTRLKEEAEGRKV